jgi:FtsP/CotA-like multicopper oxidase with cupredoxin domain
METNVMDVSDIYDKFLINGKECQLYSILGQEKSSITIPNGGASSYFWLNYAGGKMTVVANDGNDVEPLKWID